jgi:dTDP-4-dehydrorhamnose reductase
MSVMRILVLGATGMLGHAMFRMLAADRNLDVHGTVRAPGSARYFHPSLAKRLLTGIDVENLDTLTRVFGDLRPAAVINCIGLVKQAGGSENPLLAVPLNAMLPHRLAALCTVSRSRLIHISTDCVFSGKKGSYVETDVPDASDVYGLSKLLGEFQHSPVVTLRTSIIGHELAGCRGLVDWFLAQQGSVPGFCRAIFSGIPTVELAAIVRDRILGNLDLHGLYHVAAEPISKYQLLLLIARAYGKHIDIIPSDLPIIDRSLNSERFRSATGYVAPVWPELVRRMHDFAAKAAASDVP